MKRCSACKSYTMKEICSKCGAKTESAHPYKFSIEMERKYGKYRKV